MATEEPCQADAVGAASLHGECVDGSEPTGPGEELGVTVVRGVDDQWLTKSAADTVEGYRDVLVLVGVDADNDVAPVCQADVRHLL